MTTIEAPIQSHLDQRYAHGFVTDIEADTLPPGLNEDELTQSPMTSQDELTQRSMTSQIA